jgi:hypothetical protein
MECSSSCRHDNGPLNKPACASCRDQHLIDTARRQKRMKHDPRYVGMKYFGSIAWHAEVRSVTADLETEDE